MTPDSIHELATRNSLIVSGALGAKPADPVPRDTQSIALLSPAPDFWAEFSTSPEYLDTRPHPLDRWSTRVITDLAEAVGGTPVFPFGPPPYAPFFDWALRSGRAWASPVSLLVHDTQGLFISYRGAIALPFAIPDAPGRDRPCKTCARPCLTACPVSALTADGYGVPACAARLATTEGADCLNGCLVRRACPVGPTLRTPEQSAFHMAAFRRSLTP